MLIDHRTRQRTCEKTERVRDKDRFENMCITPSLCVCVCWWVLMQNNEKRFVAAVLQEFFFVSKWNSCSYDEWHFFLLFNYEKMFRHCGCSYVNVYRYRKLNERKISFLFCKLAIHGIHVKWQLLFANYLINDPITKSQSEIRNHRRMLSQNALNQDKGHTKFFVPLIVSNKILFYNCLIPLCQHDHCNV